MTVSSDLQSEKQSSPMLSTEFDMMTDFRLSHCPKQELPILVTDSGIVIVSIEEPMKHFTPRLVTVPGISVVLQPFNITFVAVSITALQLSRES